MEPHSIFSTRKRDQALAVRQLFPLAGKSRCLATVPRSQSFDRDSNRRIQLALVQSSVGLFNQSQNVFGFGAAGLRFRFLPLPHA